MRRFALILSAAALVSCEATPDPANTEAPTVSVKVLERGSLRTVLSTVPGESVDRETCGLPNAGGFDVHYVPSFPVSLLIFFADSDGVEYVRMTTPNGEQTKLQPSDAILQDGVGGAGSTAYDRIIVDRSGQRPETPLVIGFDYEPGAQSGQAPFFFGPARDAVGNGADDQLGPGLQILAKPETCNTP